MIAATRKLAVLIDGDNVSPRIAADLFRQTALLGDASVRRIYGDFSNPCLKGWLDASATHGLMPQQVSPAVAGKNATDIALVIDAMDLLLSRRVDGFCIASSDSDFTRLAARIREQGVDVFGFGEKKTPEGFRQACKTFTVVEAFAPPAEPVAHAGTKTVTAAPPQPKSAAPLIKEALAGIDAADGWYALGALAVQLRVVQPGFTHKAYGCSRLVSLVEKSGAFDIRRSNLRVDLRPKQTGAAAAGPP